ncbi:MAG: ribosome silencing factor [Bacteroidales bacterium]|jgi:ribosome-associated protein|nr:ribosome silencing factor [Bacteroidales bacterium]
MTKKTKRDSAEQILAQVVAGMQEKKAKDIVSLNLQSINHAVTKYFVICHAASKTQIGAIYNSIEEFVLKNCDAKPFHREGIQNSEWILIDYFDVVVHVFQEDLRNFYKIENLWADAPITRYKSDD